MIEDDLEYVQFLGDFLERYNIELTNDCAAKCAIVINSTFAPFAVRVISLRFNPDDAIKYLFH